jgi:hypothetical protein
LRLNPVLAPEVIAQIHNISAARGPELASYHLYFDRAAAAPARWMPANPVWKAATAAVRQPPPATTMAQIHRDYHRGNTLWSWRQLTGIVDWTQASSGPPGLDVRQMRRNLVADHGQQAADRFLDCYRAASGRVPRPGLLGPGKPARPAARRRRPGRRARRHHPGRPAALRGLRHHTARTNLTGITSIDPKAARPNNADSGGSCHGERA